MRQQSFNQRREIAAEIVDLARSAAPVRSGAYRGGMSVEVNDDSVAVVDDDPTSFYKEYGTSDTPAHAALTNAAMGFGRYSGMRPKGRRR
ncbi:hypothetical protein QVA66_03940 [Staphylococcus chromogenes]|nr:hypothetical protein [Staphylococcus chromogenes]